MISRGVDFKGLFRSIHTLASVAPLDFFSFSLQNCHKKKASVYMEKQFLSTILHNPKLVLFIIKTILDGV